MRKKEENDNSIRNSDNAQKKKIEIKPNDNKKNQIID